MFSIFAICNYEGLVLDLVGGILKHVHFRGEMADKLKDIVKHSSKHGEFPYDWNAGVFVYISALSAIFIGAIIMEVSSLVCSPTLYFCFEVFYKFISHFISGGEH